MKDSLLFFLLFLTIGCTKQDDCEINSNGSFSGKGYLYIQSPVQTDGYYSAAFFPNCKIDSSEVLSSLLQSNKGIEFSISLNNRKEINLSKSIKLTKSKAITPSYLRESLLMPVYISFVNIDSVDSKNKYYYYHIKSDKVNFKQIVHFSSYIKVKRIRQIVDFH